MSDKPWEPKARGTAIVVLDSIEEHHRRNGTVQVAFIRTPSGSIWAIPLSCLSEPPPACTLAERALIEAVVEWRMQSPRLPNQRVILAALAAAAAVMAERKPADPVADLFAEATSAASLLDCHDSREAASNLRIVLAAARKALGR